MLNSVKTDFERKRELGKIAMEIIDTYKLNVQKMPEEVKNAKRFNLKMEGKDWWYGNKIEILWYVAIFLLNVK